MNKVKSIYIHIPYCVSKCAYCDFFSKANNHSIPDEYVSALCNEILFRFKQLSVKEIETIYIGGGTPSLLSLQQLFTIVNTIKSNTSLSKNYEFTIELNPDDVNEALLDCLSKAGVTRLSLGIQSLNEQSLAFVKRRASAVQNINALDCVKMHWKGSFGVDLICGLPYETSVSFLEAINTVCIYKPQHISMYSLTIEDETPLGKLVTTGKVEYDYDFADAMWLTAKQKLVQLGYNQYEVSNFCTLNNECKHNLVYWNHQSYIGAGSGATGTIRTNVNEKDFRYTNTLEVSDYIKFWKQNDTLTNDIPQLSETLDTKTSMFEFFMMGLRKASGISKTQFMSCFEQKFPEGFITLFTNWQKKDLAAIKKENNDEFYYLTSKGFIFLNNFLEQLEL